MTLTRDEDGSSLVELVIYMLVLSILLTGLSIMFFNMWKTQATVDAQTQATTHGQLVSSEVEKAMRNATGFQVINGGNTLLVQTSFSGDRRCQAFYFNPTGGSKSRGTLHMVIAAAPAPEASSGFAWQDGVGIYGDATFSKFFTGVNALGVPTATTPIGVHYSFAATAPDSTTKSGPVVFTGTAYPRNSTLGGTSACWP